jgi:hypothetical protein
MKSKWATKLAIWLGTITFLTALAIVIWQTVSGGSQSTESLKWLQLLQTTGTFLLPPVLCAWIWDEHHAPFRWLGLRSSANWQTQKSSPPPSVKLSSQKLDGVGSVDLTPGKKHSLMLALVNI